MMDVKECCKAILQNELGKVLRLHQNLPLWHYVVDCHTDSVHNLVLYLQLSPELYYDLLTVCGLASSKGISRTTNVHARKKVHIQMLKNTHHGGNGWDMFRVEQNLEAAYFDHKRLTATEQGQFPEELMGTRKLWIGLGVNKEGEVKTNPATQFENSKSKPPRISSASHISCLKNFKKKVIRTLEYYHAVLKDEEQEKQEKRDHHGIRMMGQDEQAAERDPLEPELPRMNDESSRPAQHSTSQQRMETNILELAAELMLSLKSAKKTGDVSISLSSSSDDEVQAGQESHQEQEQEVVEQVSYPMVISAAETFIRMLRTSQAQQQMNRLKAITGVEGGDGDNCILHNIDDNPTQFPTLSQLGFPITKYFVKTLLREIVRLSIDLPNEELLTYRTHRGTKCTLVNISKARGEEAFRKSVSRKNSWIEQLPTLVFDSECAGNDQERKQRLDYGATTSLGGSLASTTKTYNVGAFWIMKRLGRLYEDEMLSSIEWLGYKVQSHRMSAETAAAMWQEANVNLQSQRVILQYMAKEFGRRLTVPEAQVNALGELHVHPRCSSYIDQTTGKSAHFWTKPVDRLVEVSLASELTQRCKNKGALNGGLAHKKAVEEIGCVDLVIGGDHGIGKFRAVMKIIARNRVGVSIMKKVLGIGHIDCTKDNYDVLANSIGPELNRNLESIMNSRGLLVTVMGGGTGDTKVQLLRNGDLAFYADILGKPNMSGDWCVWCSMSASQWSAGPVDGHFLAGQQWTLQSMKQLRAAITEGRVRKEPQNVKGCVAEPLLSVEVTDYILPVLHCEIGMGNKLLDEYFNWADWRVERIPEQEISARNAMFEAEIEFNDAMDNFDAWMSNDGATLGTLKCQRGLLKEMRSQRDSSDLLVHTVGQRKQLTKEIEELTKQIQPIEVEKRKQEGIVKVFQEMLMNKKKAYRKVKQGQTIQESPVKQRLEKILVECGIQRAAYHGGALNGKNVQTLLQDARTIFRKMGDVLRAVDERSGRCTDEEIIDMSNRYSTLCTLLDLTFSLARTPTGQVDASIVATAKRSVQATMVKWRDLLLSTRMPKIHALESHLVQQMERWNGIGDFLEDFIEQAHQFGRSDEERTRSWRDRSRAALAHSKWEWSRVMSPGVQQAKLKVASETKRKRKVGSVEIAVRRREKAREERKKRRMDVLDLVSL